ncbi:tumor necrosis factor receptor superfamily member 5 isoform X2 [Gouania willdenowi]|uniref:tumor necrosis factor receptor superfamily member 5 isoform X2 n=1 Tax=Gouania willdenowi TaxID=441366 RepID=UPI0010545B13|nr:tumor necrosis factor receptor superfamily member 3 isoform X2 [Gouania willdenowi]
MICTDKDKYLSKAGICCDRCPAGEHVKTECTGTRATECAVCGRDLYTATVNHLLKCHVCKDCSLKNNKRTLDHCSSKKDTVCECVTGFYCNNDDCDHCQPVDRCLPGEGVKLPATRTNNTVCAPCVNGSFSNVTDFTSPCKAHTRCEEYGRLLKTQGSPKADSVCGNFKSYCSWMLPAGLWSGLVVTIIIVLVFILWRAKRKHYKTERSSPAAVKEIISTSPLTPLNSVSHCCNSCTKDEDDVLLSCAVHERLNTIPAKCLPMASASPADFKRTNKEEGCCDVLKSHSEPQEDEWCGKSP